MACCHQHPTHCHQHPSQEELVKADLKTAVKCALVALLIAAITAAESVILWDYSNTVDYWLIITGGAALALFIATVVVYTFLSYPQAIIQARAQDQEQAQSRAIHN